VGDIEIALLGIGLDAGFLERGEPGGLEEAVDGLRRRADARARIVFLGLPPERR
jgi:hypothetical protein